MNNNTFKEIADALEHAYTIGIYPHILMDGDALGSAAAICIALRKKGKDASVVIEDKIPDNLSFLDRNVCTSDQKRYEHADVSLCVDCGELSRFPERADTFLSGKKKICIDHHPTSEGIGDLNYIDGSAAATGELIYELLLAMDADIDTVIANSLFAAITTDTGNFQYSNTTRRSHEIVMKLYDHGLDSYDTSVMLYENESFAKIRLMGIIMSEAEVFAGGKAIIACVSNEMLRQAGAQMEDSEGIVGTMRSIKGIDIAVLVKEVKDNVIKVSMRAKEGNVSEIAVRFGGGGHVKAAGCTLNGDLAAVRKKMQKAVEESLCRE